jgi:hypothetical protein
VSDISSELAHMALRVDELRKDLHKLTDLTQDFWDERSELGDDRLRESFNCVKGATQKVWEAEILLSEAIRYARRPLPKPPEST